LMSFSKYLSVSSAPLDTLILHELVLYAFFHIFRRPCLSETTLSPFLHIQTPLSNCQNECSTHQDKARTYQLSDGLVRSTDQGTGLTNSESPTNTNGINYRQDSSTAARSEQVLNDILAADNFCSYVWEDFCLHKNLISISSSFQT
jgi:hypothetical protein